MKDLPVHPAAAVFPMLPDDELQQLANDIKDNGLQVPIVVGLYDGTKHLIDGRNRLAACKMAGVEPEYRELNGQDPTAFILSANINRRHMTKGQRAMATAMLYPEKSKGGRGKINSEKIAEFTSTRYVQMAREVLEHAPDLADAVLSGSKPLHEAHEIAKKREHEAKAFEPRLAKVRQRRPELADMIVEERLSLEAAETELREMDNREKERVQIMNTAFKDILSGAIYLEGNGQVEKFRNFITAEPDKISLDGGAAALRKQLKSFADRIHKVVS